MMHKRGGRGYIEHWDEGALDQIDICYLSKNHAEGQSGEHSKDARESAVKGQVGRALERSVDARGACRSSIACSGPTTSEIGAIGANGTSLVIELTAARRT